MRSPPSTLPTVGDRKRACKNPEGDNSRAMSSGSVDSNRFSHRSNSASSTSSSSSSSSSLVAATNADQQQQQRIQPTLQLSTTVNTPSTVATPAREFYIPSLLGGTGIIGDQLTSTAAASRVSSFSNSSFVGSDWYVFFFFFFFFSWPWHSPPHSFL